MVWRIANGRAAARSRRYFVKNQLRYMWVLTFRESARDRRTVMRQVSGFARRVRADLVGRPFPYWYSPELHPGGHGWHVNFFVPMYLNYWGVKGLWDPGDIIWVTDFEKSPAGPKGEPLGVCRTPREGWRRAAQYGCKYAQKDWSRETIDPSNHRYEVAQGFSPTPERTWVPSREAGWELMSHTVAGEDWSNLAVWDSEEDPEWNRPPVATFRW